MRFYLSIFFLMLLCVPAMAQTKSATIPALPEALVPLEDKGAQLRYLGTENGMDGWIAIYQGQEQYYYITPDKKAFVTGLMFAQDGRPITIDQVKDLQAQNGGALDLLAQDKPESEQPKKLSEVKSVTEGLSARTPAQRMFSEVENSNWVRLGSADAPVIYSFVDPQCPHCHEFMNDIKEKYIDSGVMQVRIIPVGFQSGSLAQAAFLLGAPNGEELFFRHLAGDETALPAKSDMSTQAVQKNMALMQAWKFNVTPLTVYKAKDGEIKIIRGRAKDAATIVADLPSSPPKP